MQADLRTLLMNAGLPRVVWNERPQGSALPAVVLTIVAEATPYVYDGPVPLISTRVQADIYAGLPADALATDRALVAAVNGYRGMVGETEFLGIFLESRFDGPEQTVSGAVVHRISRDLMVKHKPA